MLTLTSAANQKLHISLAITSTYCVHAKHTVDLVCANARELSLFAPKWWPTWLVLPEMAEEQIMEYTFYKVVFSHLPVTIASSVWPVLTWQLPNSHFSKRADQQLGYMQHQGMCPRGDELPCLTPCHMAVLCRLCVHLFHQWAVIPDLL